MTSLLAYLQAAIPQPPALGSLLQAGGGLVIIGLQGWLISTVRDVRDEARSFRQHLFGVNGDNGMNSEVKALEARCNRQDAQLGLHETRLVVLEYERDHKDDA